MAQRPTWRILDRNRRGSQSPAEPPASPARRATQWIFAAVLAGVATLIGVVAVPALLADIPALQDKIRPGDEEIRVMVHERGFEYSYSLAMPGPYSVTAEQRRLMADLGGGQGGESNTRILYQQLQRAGCPWVSASSALRWKADAARPSRSSVSVPN